MVKITGGEKKGVRLFSCNSKSLRPAPSKVKEAIFSILGHEVQGKMVLDMFAGTGAFGLEAISRGASGCYLIELNKRIFNTLKRNISLLGYDSVTRAFNLDAFRFIRDTSVVFDIIYVAPPQFIDFSTKALMEIFSRPGLVNSQGFVIVQLDKREEIGISPVFFELIKDKIYGDTRVIFYQKKII